MLCKHFYYFENIRLENMNLGPNELLQVNPKLVIARITSYGQTDSKLSHMAGHDLNFVALSGLLSRFVSPGHPRPVPPLNIAGDFAGGSLLAVIGILVALRSEKGQVVDAGMCPGLGYVSSFLWRNWACEAGKIPISEFTGDVSSSSSSISPFGATIGKDQPIGWVEGRYPTYTVYECKDGKWMAVGCLEPQFYKQFFKLMKMPDDSEQKLMQEPDRLREEIAIKFKTQPRHYWENIFCKADCCVTPILTMTEAWERNNFSKTSGPLLWPRLLDSNKNQLLETKGCNFKPCPRAGQQTYEILAEAGLSQDAIRNLEKGGVIASADATSKL